MIRLALVLLFAIMAGPFAGWTYAQTYVDPGNGSPRIRLKAGEKLVPGSIRTIGSAAQASCPNCPGGVPTYVPREPRPLYVPAVYPPYPDGAWRFDIDEFTRRQRSAEVKTGEHDRLGSFEWMNPGEATYRGRSVDTADELLQSLMRDAGR